MSHFSLKIKIFLALYLAFIIAVGYFLLFPNITKLASNQQLLAQKKSQFEINEDKISSLEKTNQSIAEFEQKNKTVIELLPDNPEVSSFVVNVEALAKSLDQNITNFTIDNILTSSKSKSTNTEDGEVAAESSKKSDKGIKFSINSSSDFSGFLNFISKMETLARFNTISSIELSTKDLSLNYKLTGYIYNGK